MGTFKPSGQADFVTALLSTKMIEALDRYVLENEQQITRSDALREVCKEWCIDHGYINPNDIERDPF